MNFQICPKIRLKYSQFLLHFLMHIHVLMFLKLLKSLAYYSTGYIMYPITNNLVSGRYVCVLNYHIKVDYK